MKFAFQEQFSYTMAVRGLLDGGSVIVLRMRAFAVASAMGLAGLSVAVAAASPNCQRPCCLVCPNDLEPR